MQTNNIPEENGMIHLVLYAKCPENIVHVGSMNKNANIGKKNNIFIPLMF